MDLQIVLLDYLVGPHRAISASLPTIAPRASISAISTSKARPAEVDRLAVGDELAAVWQHPETAERDGRRCFGGAFHRSLSSGLGRRGKKEEPALTPVLHLLQDEEERKLNPRS